MSIPTDGTMPPLGDTEDGQLQAVTGLHKIGMAIRHAYWAGGEILGLTPSQAQILQVMRSRPDQDIRLDDIARELAVAPATASVAVKTLVSKGLVVRQRSEVDARSIRLELSPEGLKLAQRSAGWSDFLADAVGVLEPEEQSVFQRSIVKMIRTMQERGQIPLSRMCVNCTHFRPGTHNDASKPHHCAYVDAAFGDGNLRLDCVDFSAASEEEREVLWELFLTTDVVGE